MIIVVVRHKIRPGSYAAALLRIEGTTRRILEQPGNLFRYFGDADEGREIVSVTAWRSREDRAVWDAARSAQPPPGDMSDVYDGFEVTEIDCSSAASIPG